MLSGLGIRAERAFGRIVIEPFEPLCINPNSYDLRLANELRVYDGVELRLGKDNPTRLVQIGDGVLLLPGRLYLGSTVEYTETHWPWIPTIEGKSSVARCGLNVHATGGFGDCGFQGTWTLEMFVVQPLWVFAGARICQIAYHRIEGEVRPEYLYSGRYQGQRGPTAPRQEKEAS